MRIETERAVKEKKENKKKKKKSERKPKQDKDLQAQLGGNRPSFSTLKIIAAPSLGNSSSKLWMYDSSPSKGSGRYCSLLLFSTEIANQVKSEKYQDGTVY